LYKNHGLEANPLQGILQLHFQFKKVIQSQDLPIWECTKLTLTRYIIGNDRFPSHSPLPWPPMTGLRRCTRNGGENIKCQDDRHAYECVFISIQCSPTRPKHWIHSVRVDGMPHVAPYTKQQGGGKARPFMHAIFIYRTHDITTVSPIFKEVSGCISRAGAELF